MPHRTVQPIFVHGINGGTRVFMPDPREGSAATRWIMTDACVALVKCSQCGAKPMELCRFDSMKLCVTTHWVRRAAAGKISEWKVSELKKIGRIATTFQDLEGSDEGAEDHW